MQSSKLGTCYLQLEWEISLLLGHCFDAADCPLWCSYSEQADDDLARLIENVELEGPEEPAQPSEARSENEIDQTSSR